MVIWKGVRHDPIWGECPYYRFPMLAWLIGEFRYRVIFKLKIWLAVALRKWR